LLRRKKKGKSTPPDLAPVERVNKYTWGKPKCKEKKIAENKCSSDEFMAWSYPAPAWLWRTSNARAQEREGAYAALGVEVSGLEDVALCM
jgi:hypothetical protein